MSLPTMTIVGRLGADPKPVNGKNGKTYASLFVLANSRRRNQQTGEWENADSSAKSVIVWQERLAANILASLHKGDAVIVTGSEHDTTYQDIKSTQVVADHVAVDLQFNQVSIQHHTHSQNSGSSAGTFGSPYQADDYSADPWTSGPRYNDDHEPEF